jgi:hypothetical protein
MLDRLKGLWLHRLGNWTPELDSVSPLEGARHALSVVFTTLPHGIRESVFFLFTILLLRALLRNDWLAIAGFGLLFSVFDFLSASHPVINGMFSFAIVAAIAFVTVRWGMLSLAVAITASGVLGTLPPTTNSSAWYFTASIFLLALVFGLAVWAFRTAMGGQRLLKADWLG